MVAATRQDRGNLRTWSKAATIRALDRQGFVPGEREPFELVRAQLRARPVLELGVGTGRTVAFTEPLTGDYRALDYTQAMVDRCRSAYPQVRIELGDARTLDGIPDAHFGLVTFAYNGIDAVSHADRARVLRAVRRVLAPGGMFFFSTLNLDGPDTRERPWHFTPCRAPGVLAHVKHAAYSAGLGVVALAHWLALQRRIERGPGWAVAPLPAHEFGILAHFTTLARQLDELAEHGFATGPAVFSSNPGGRITLGDDTREVGFFHLVAHAP